MKKTPLVQCDTGTQRPLEVPARMNSVADADLIAIFTFSEKSVNAILIITSSIIIVVYLIAYN